MSAGMTPEQRQAFDEQGFVTIPDILPAETVARLSDAVDRLARRYRQAKSLGPDTLVAVNNLSTHDNEFLDLIDHASALPLIIDCIGWNIQMSAHRLEIVPPGSAPPASGGRRQDSWHADLSAEEHLMATSIDGRMPFMELAVEYFLADGNDSAIDLIPGSYQRELASLNDPRYEPTADEVAAIRPRTGMGLLWRTATWHRVPPNDTDRWRVVLHVAYNYRWLRPRHYLMPDPDLLARSSPIRRQLLGGLGTGGNPLGEDLPWNPHPQYWITKNWDNAPLRAWAAERFGAATMERVFI